MAEFEGAGEAEGLQIWRIEKMVPTPVPKEFYGQFYSGDSYIVLSTKTTPSGAKAWDLHFWLGSETSKDEAGAAAYKTVELDDKLGGGPTQHRECQDHESALFLSYFKDGGIEYLEGGVESGFKHVVRDEYPTRLVQIKGRRNARVKTVELAASSMNHGDVFILDAGMKLFLWTGAEANRYEKARGVQVLTRIRNERGARPESIVVSDDPDNEEFWGLLGGTIDDVKSAEEGGDDKAEEAEGVQLFKVSDASGTLEVTEIERVDGQLKRDMLDTNDVFIVDNGSAIWVWIGKGATDDEKKNGMKIAQEYLTAKERPDWTPVTRVVENAEPTDMKALFGQWEAARPIDFTQMYKSSGVAGAAGREIETREVDIADLHKQFASDTAEELDDGSGELTIWQIVNFEKVPLKEELYGQFYGGDSYIVLYKYTDKRGAEQAVIYFWQGKKSSIDEKGSSALLTTELAKELPCKSSQVRVVQGKEPSHFCNLFKGNMIVHAGGVAGKFDGADAGAAAEAAAADSNGLYHVKGSRPGNTSGVEVDVAASSLNSGDCFVLRTDSRVVVWQGKGSNDQEKASAAGIADIIKGSLEVAVFAEGDEDDEFWEALGGKGEYASSPSLEDLPHEPRLFQISNVSGQVAVDHVPNYSQEDLLDEDVMMLDCYNEVFVWIGSQSNEQERAEGPNLAKQYVTAAADGRDPDTPIIVIEAGSEPDIFTAHFQGWDYEKFKTFEDPYEKRLRLMREAKAKEEPAAPVVALRKTEKKAADPPTPPTSGGAGGAGGAAEAEAAAPAAEPAAAPAAAAAEPTKAIYSQRGKGGEWTLEQLKSGEATGVNPQAKETYLSDKEFEEVFKMDKAAFEAMPKWKRQNAKKAVGIF